jgi:hypothetical protein
MRVLRLLGSASLGVWLSGCMTFNGAELPRTDVGVVGRHGGEDAAAPIA